MEETWSHRGFEVRGGLKPGSRHFQYFFVVSRGREKVSKYCVWIEDDALSGFDPAEDFESILSSNKEQWNGWVKEKIEKENFRSTVLKYDKSGSQEVDLEQMDEKLTMD
jgi:hypothetical protein